MIYSKEYSTLQGRTFSDWWAVAQHIEASHNFNAFENPDLYEEITWEDNAPARSRSRSPRRGGGGGGGGGDGGGRGGGGGGDARADDPPLSVATNKQLLQEIYRRMPR